MAKKRSKERDESDINITMFRKNGTGDYVMQYRNPISGRKIRKTTGTDKLREAKKVRDKWQAQITDGKDWTRGKMYWQEFRAEYEQCKLPSLAPKSRAKSIGVLNVLDRLIGPRRLRDVNSSSLDKYQTALRKSDRSENTIKSHLNTIRAALSWAHLKGWIAEVPMMPKIERAKGIRTMKGRPITEDEFNQMLNAVPKIIVEPNVRGSAKPKRIPDARRIPSWQHLLRGLWLSGLRLSEAIDLH